MIIGIMRSANRVLLLSAVVSAILSSGAAQTRAAGINPWRHSTAGVGHFNHPDPHDIIYDSTRLPSGAVIHPISWIPNASVADNRGSAWAECYSGWGLLNPQIKMKAEVFDHAGGFDSADCEGEILDSFRHTGAAPGVIAATLSIHAHITDPRATGVPRITGFLGIYGTDPSVESKNIYDDVWETNAMHLAPFEKTMIPIDVGPTGGAWQTVDLPIVFPVDPNEKFYMYVYVLGKAWYGDSVMDASATIGVTFDEPSQVEVLPEPGTLALLMLGAAALCPRRRRA